MIRFSTSLQDKGDKVPKVVADWVTDRKIMSIQMLYLKSTTGIRIQVCARKMNQRLKSTPNFFPKTRTEIK